MSVPFSRTMRALEADRLGRSVALMAAAIGLLAVWGVWFFRARIAVYETSPAARLEVRRAGGVPIAGPPSAGSVEPPESGGRPVDAAVDGRVVSMSLALGRTVREGDVLVELDGQVAAERLAEARARIAAVAPQVDARRRELAAEEALLEQGAARSARAIAQARARREEAAEAAKLADEEAARIERMLKGGAATEIEAIRARAARRERQAQAEAAALEIDRLGWQGRTEASEGRARAARILSAIADLEGEQARATAAAEALRRELERHVVRAPIGGVIGEVSAQKVGAFVKAGERLATIVPSGEVGAAADFAPSAAMGRIRAGQPARVRLEGFPWAQYGHLRARVTRVGGEVREGKVRVELAIEPDPASAIPLQHGLPGEVEVEVEQVTPYRLALRLVTDALTDGPERK
jgi:multidrug resistance efflux pump